MMDDFEYYKNKLSPETKEFIDMNQFKPFFREYLNTRTKTDAENFISMLNSRSNKGRNIIKILKLRKNLKTATILDIGCGEGIITQVISMQCKKIIGITLWSNLSLFNRNYSEAELISGDARYLPYEDNAFDIIVCNQAYEHIPDHKILVDEM